MQPDLIIRGANLPDGREDVDILVADGIVQVVGPQIPAEGRREIEAHGRLVAPPFVDCHFHMDATLSLGLPRLNRSGTLLEGIQLWGELKPLLTHEAVVERALAYCDMAAAQGIQAIRSHVDVCDDRLVGVEALLDVKRRVAPYLTLQLVAFPQDGFYRYPTARQNLLRALDLGVDVVGGIPHFERTMADGARSVAELCEIAADRGLQVDMHCDETDDPLSRHIETLACETQRLGLSGRVAGSHLTSMHSMDNYYVSKLLPLIAEAGVAAIANPLINITIQGRHDTYPKRRGLTRVAEMWGHGIPAALGQDCVMDPWYSLGSGDMLEVAHMAVHVGQLTSLDAMRRCFEAVTAVPAGILGLEGYGLDPGCRADMVILEAKDPVEAIRLRAARLFVLRAGEVVAQSPPRVATLDLPGRPGAVAFTR
ncbi:MAG TPA: amidohydrolase family protein [Geminicoccaceae bacterium]|nr:amidohydrolase family protein [Geminicoccus sp.]HMU48903.1 amidohydrolase family protein [Geminicoccaceae bacterium]